MKIGKKLRRICAAAVAAAIGLTSWQMFLPELVEAASGDYYVKFVNLGSSEYSDYAEVVMGESVDTVANIPPLYEYAPDAFRIVSARKASDNSEITPIPAFSEVMSVPDRSKKNVTIQTIYNASIEERLYNIDPIFNASLSQSTYGLIQGVTYTQDESDPKKPAKDPDGNDLINEKDEAGTTATVAGSQGSSGGTISIIESSSITLEFDDDTFLYYTNDGIRVFDGKLKVSDAAGEEATGNFTGYDQALVETGTTSPTGFIVTLNSTAASSPQIRLNVLMPTRKSYKKGTKITIVFRPESVTGVRLLVIPPKVAVNRLAAEIRDNFEDFVELETPMTIG